jgi:hypothetical protein
LTSTVAVREKAGLLHNIIIPAGKIKRREHPAGEPFSRMEKGIRVVSGRHNRILPLTKQGAGGVAAP